MWEIVVSIATVLLGIHFMYVVITDFGKKQKS